MSIIGGIIALVMYVVGLVIVDNVLKDQTFNSTLANTVKDFIVPIGMLGALGLVAGIAYLK